MFSRPFIFSLISLLVLFVALSASPLVISRIVTSSSGFAGCQALSVTGEINPGETQAYWENRPVSALNYLADTLTSDQKKVLGASSGEKWIEVDLSDQKLIAHQGETIVLESFISSGLWNSTPPGEYRIWYKIKSTKMEGGSKLNGSYYYLPNVPYAMFFYGDYGIHGTYWHSDFGRPRSHGCVNAPTPIAERLFYWTDPQLPEGKNIARSAPENPGTRVVIHP